MFGSLGREMPRVPGLHSRSSREPGASRVSHVACTMGLVCMGLVSCNCLEATDSVESGFESFMRQHVDILCSD